MNAQKSKDAASFSSINIFFSYLYRRVPGRSPGVWLLSDALPQMVMVGNDNGVVAAPGTTVPAVEAVKIFRTGGEKHFPKTTDLLKTHKTVIQSEKPSEFWKRFGQKKKPSFLFGQQYR